MILAAMATIEEANRVSQRLEAERGIFLYPDRFVLDGREELDPAVESGLLVEYGFDALVRYYCPNDPRLDPSGLLR